MSAPLTSLLFNLHGMNIVHVLRTCQGNNELFQNGLDRGLILVSWLG